MCEQKFYKQSWFWLLVAIVVFLINQLPFLTDMRPVMYDEAWYANTAYNFAQGDGFLNTIVGTRGNSNYLLPTLTGVMFWIFGYSLFTIRLTAVLCGVITILFQHLCLKELRSSVVAEIAVLGFFVSIALFNTIFRFGRPECAALMCVAGGLWFFLRYIREHSWWNMIGLAAFTFLAAIGHPYALLVFAIIGLMLLVGEIREKNWTTILQLSVLFIAAVAAIGSIAWVSNIYNGEGENYVSERFSMSNLGEALPEYIKSAFLSKHVLYMPFLLCVALFCCFNTDNRVKVLAFITIIYAILFPFLFSTDFAMIGLGGDYVALIATLLIAPCVDKYKVYKYGKIILGIFALYSFANMGISYYFNYKVKYEKANTVLAVELPSLIPHDAIVYTPIRQYPMLMHYTCFSDHTWTEMPSSYDFIVQNSQDKDIYSNSQRVYSTLDDYELIYERDTKQYGLIKVFKHK